MRVMLKWAAVAVTAMLLLGGCVTAHARRAEGATTVKPEQIFAD
ncbi:MAG TPA: hypothetical protein VFX14_22835 [Methylomirabilota bacterium]|nr:hypothetical protein [Methylomirabilota bacterium]